MTSLALFRVLAPALADVGDDVVNVYLALAASEHDASAWGAVFQQAMVWYAAHRLERTPEYGSAAAGAAGALLSQTDGDLSRTYAAPAAPGSTADADLSSTPYGAAYLALRRKRAAGAPALVGPTTILG